MEEEFESGWRKQTHYQKACLMLEEMALEGRLTQLQQPSFQMALRL